MLYRPSDISATSRLLCIHMGFDRVPTAAVSVLSARAVGLGDSGSVYFGVNIEFPGVPLNQSVRGAFRQGAGWCKPEALMDGPA